MPAERNILEESGGGTDFWREKNEIISTVSPLSNENPAHPGKPVAQPIWAQS